MKKWIVMLLCCLLLTGCATTGTTDPTNSTDATPGTEQTQPTQTDAPGTDPTDEAPVETDPSAEPTESLTVKFTIYTPNENLDGFYATEIVVDELTAQNVVSELVKEKVLSEAITVNSAQIVNGQLNLDFNSAFADLINTQGSTGESMMIGSVVNTFLSAYGPSGAESVYITVDGQILESGHVVYDFPLEFRE